MTGEDVMFGNTHGVLILYPRIMPRYVNIVSIVSAGACKLSRLHQTHIHDFLNTMCHRVEETGNMALYLSFTLSYCHNRFHERNRNIELNICGKQWSKPLNALFEGIMPLN